MEMKVALAKENLEAFHRASRGMNQSMTYNMANALKKLVKSHKGVMKITNSFLDLLENVGSFSRDKIPISVLRRMHSKKLLGSAYYSGGSMTGQLLAGYVKLKKSNPEKYSVLKVDSCYSERLRRIHREKKEGTRREER